MPWLWSPSRPERAGWNMIEHPKYIPYVCAPHLSSKNRRFRGDGSLVAIAMIKCIVFLQNFVEPLHMVKIKFQKTNQRSDCAPPTTWGKKTMPWGCTGPTNLKWFCHDVKTKTDLEGYMYKQKIGGWHEFLADIYVGLDMIRNATKILSVDQMSDKILSCQFIVYPGDST